MADPMSPLPSNQINSVPLSTDDEITWHDPPSSPFISHVESDQENVPPVSFDAPMPVKPGFIEGENVPQSAFKISSPSKTLGLKDRTTPVKNSPVKMSPTKQLLNENEDTALRRSLQERGSPKKASPIKQTMMERPESAMSDRSHKNISPSKSSHASSVESAHRLSDSIRDIETTPETLPSPAKRLSLDQLDPTLKDKEGITVAMKIMEETRSESHESHNTYHTENQGTNFDIEDTDFNPDGPDLTSLTVDDTCFSAFSEMPNLDMTKFAIMRKSPTKNGLFDQATPRARTQITPSTIRRSERTPSPTPRRGPRENDTTNLLLDFTAQIEAFSTASRHSPTRRQSPLKSSTESSLLSYIQNQRSPVKGSSFVPSTPAEKRQLLNLLDFELPPPPTPRSVPTVTIRELESLKSTFQSQISSLTASLSGKEAEVESLVKAVSNAERRVGEAQEMVRDERSAREHAESQMADWKMKGEEVQKLLQDVQAELARNDEERSALLTRINEMEKRTEEAEARASELESRAIEAESKNVDMTTFINPDESEENRKIYSEAECQAAIAEKVNDVARDLHAAYKAKHEKKIKALKENYQRKADERCKELRVQIIRLERQVEEVEKRKDDTFSKVLPADLKTGAGPCEKCRRAPSSTPAVKVSDPDDLKRLEEQKSEIENLKAKLAGLQSELQTLRTSYDSVLQELEAERIEKGDLVAAAEQMLALCGEKMEEMQQEELRKSQMGPPAPATQRPGSAMGERLGAMGADASTRTGGSGIAKPSGLRAPGGFGFQGGSGLNKSTSGNKSRILSNIERMGGGRAE
ncbi:hypothetical protein K469DRAFT_735875 [Zopfia rhizophila CBS 207.26]|uniref:Uncharacterized protein n=1 Tax=Zopfia rhizophila CBS 207.26 TaxID=1314779 RepID=A0A6A6EGX5_9PEZI|nr:hypothetical protein K469DRAFT_735875 [Zopfia rhizophila CBS 207.26]